MNYALLVAAVALVLLAAVDPEPLLDVFERWVSEQEVPPDPRLICAGPTYPSPTGGSCDPPIH